MPGHNAFHAGRLAGAALLGTFLLLSLPLTDGSAFGQAVFRWKDNAGVLHFTDDFSSIPAEYRRKSAEETRREATPLTEETLEGPEAKAPADDGKARAPKVRAHEPGSPGAPAPAKPPKAPGAATDAAPGKSAPTGYTKALKASRLSVDNLGRDKQYWQDRRTYWERRLATSEALYAKTKREFNLTNQRFDKKEYTKLKELRERMRALETAIADAKAMLDGGLAREARRAGAQPGWVR